MTWSNTDEQTSLQLITADKRTAIDGPRGDDQLRTITCPSCGHTIQLQDQAGGRLQDLPGLPAGVKFDPSDQEILQHLEAKVSSDVRKIHPLIDEFITTIEGENGICCTHPEKLPGVNKDGQVRHFFHRPSKAYTTGTRKRRKVHSDPDDDGRRETRWHKTGKTRAVTSSSTGGTVVIKGYKKILVLYTNYGRQRKPEKTNWVMHQYHLGDNEEEKDGELVVSKVFYQTQPRQCGGASSAAVLADDDKSRCSNKTGETVGPNYDKNNAAGFVEYYNPGTFVSSYNVGSQQDVMNRDSLQPQMIPNNFVLHGDGSSSVIHLPSGASNGK